MKAVEPIKNIYDEHPLPPKETPMLKYDFKERFMDAGWQVKTSQNSWEFNEFLSWIKSIHDFPSPFKYLEIGSYAGESLYYLAQILPEHSVVTLVDLGDNKSARTLLTDKVIPSILKDKDIDLVLLHGNSQNPEVVQAAKNRGPYDLCFIDANHEFASAFEDYKNYKDLAVWLAFHDISEWSIQKGVKKYGKELASVAHLWKVLKHKSKTFKEFIYQGEPTKEYQPCGIGVAASGDI